MATIKSYSDLQQSRKLAEILPLESADMKILPFTEREYRVVPINDIAVCGRDDEIYAWSLAALLDVLPEYNLQRTDWGNDKTEYKIVVTVNDNNYASNNYDNSLDACVAMIEKLHKLKML